MQFRSLWPAILWSSTILVLSFMPGKSFPSVDWMDWFKVDKWIHAFLYFTLFILIYIPIRKRRSSKFSQFVKIGIAYCLLLGVFTELVQAFFLSDRSGDIADMVANMFGILVAIVLLRILTRKWPWKAVNEETVEMDEQTV